MAQYLIMVMCKRASTVNSFSGKIPIFRQTLTFVVLSTLFFNSTAQLVSKIYYKSDFEDRIDSLTQAFGQNKSLPKGYEIATLVALSHYPELKEINIRFVLKETFAPLISRPKISSIIKPKKKWEYLVIISDHNNEDTETILLKNLSFNAQVGIIGHELAHTAYYLNKKSGDMIGVGFNYFNKKYRACFEKDTDRRAIDHGLGWQLYDYAIFSRSLPTMTRENIDWIDKYYMNGAAIYNYMKHHPLYQKSFEKL